MTRYLVVAKHSEDVSWLSGLPKDVKVYVYDKGPGGLYENKGREAETFARFLVEHYDVLRPEDVVYFVQGDPFDHCPELLNYFNRDPPMVTTPLGRLHSCDGQGYPHHPGLPLREMHSMLFHTTQTTWEFVAGAQYAVPGARILDTPREVYHTLHTYLADGTICPWTMERLWPVFF